MCNVEGGADKILNYNLLRSKIINAKIFSEITTPCRIIFITKYHYYFFGMNPVVFLLDNIYLSVVQSTDSSDRTTAERQHQYHHGELCTCTKSKTNI
jgi:hypothetical protein